ncbi:hypothetical protein HK104_008413 [Borealophlyctis nickersoniae]|nr:hypothetical protein HK104_008413 [Borealophlyctis nickersoniae]
MLCNGNATYTNCYCDCCPACNDCNQLFIGCASRAFQSDVHFDPPLATFIEGQPIQPRLLTSDNGDPLFLIGQEPCIRPPLPPGLSLKYQPTEKSGTFALVGTPESAFPSTPYRAIFPASAQAIKVITFQLSVSNTLATFTRVDEPTPSVEGNSSVAFTRVDETTQPETSFTRISGETKPDTTFSRLDTRDL